MPCPANLRRAQGDWSALLEPLRSDPARTRDPHRRRRDPGADRRARRGRERCPSGRAPRWRALNERFGLVGCISGRQALDARAAGRARRARLRRQPRARAAAAGRRGAAARPLAGGPRGRGERVPRRSRRRGARRGRAAARGQGADPGAALARRRRRGCGRGAGARDRRRRRARRGWNRAGGARCWSCGRPGGGGKDGGGRRADRRRGARRTPSTPATTAPTSTPSGACASCATSGELATAVCVGVLSAEGPAELAEEADLTVDGPEGWLGDPRGAGGVAVPYTDLLRITVFLTGAEATALGAITALGASRDGDATDDPRRRRLVARLAGDRPLPRPPRARRRRRPRRARPRPHRHLAAPGDARPGSRSAASGRSALTAIVAGVLGIFFPGVAVVGAGYALIVSLAWHTREAAVLGDRAARRRQVLRRPQLGLPPDPAGADAGPAQRSPRLAQRDRPCRRYATRKTIAVRASSFLNSRQPRVLATSAAVSQARRAVATA